MFKQVHPVLPCKDVSQAIEYYVAKLGFTLVFKDGDSPQYAGVRRGGVELHLQWHDVARWEKDEIESLMLRFEIEDVQALYAELKERGAVPANKTIRETPWGTREFAFFDPNQNGLTFYEDL